MKRCNCWRLWAVAIGTGFLESECVDLLRVVAFENHPLMIKRYLLAASLITQMICGTVAQQTGTVRPPPPPQRTTQQPQKPDDDDVVKITTNLVQVDAVVFDKNGKPVTDLRPDEVQIFEDGKQQKVTHFAYNMTGTG